MGSVVVSKKRYGRGLLDTKVSMIINDNSFGLSLYNNNKYICLCFYKQTLYLTVMGDNLLFYIICKEIYLRPCMMHNIATSTLKKKFLCTFRLTN